MQGRNHLALALLGAMVVVSPGEDVSGWVALGLGSLAPDIDGHGTISHPGAFMPRMTPRPIRAIADGIGHVVSDGVQAVFGHRGAFHYPIWYVAMALIGWHLGLSWLMWLGIGCLAHLAGDIITKSGIPVFGPLSRRDIAMPPYIKTGTWGEEVIGLVIWGVIAWRGWVLAQSLPAAQTAIHTAGGWLNAWLH